MRAFYRTGMKGPMIVGQHKAGQQRFWVIDCTARSETSTEKMVIRPEQKCTLMDLHDLVLDELAAFEDENGPILAVEWSAFGR